jgi:hypothetical protein
VSALLGRFFFAVKEARKCIINVSGFIAIACIEVIETTKPGKELPGFLVYRLTL